MKRNLKHRYLVILLILIISGINIFSTYGKVLQDKNLNSFYNYNIEGKTNNNFQDNLTLQDDALHKTYNFYHIETWYFDSIFKNNYSFALVITVVQRSNNGFVMIALSIYKDGELLSFTRETYLFKKLLISEEKPFIKLNNKMLITGEIDSISDSWLYNIFLEIDKKIINLRFRSIANGWKSDIIGGWWLTIPRLNVTGWIQFDNNNISVSGEGYHDHNWFYIHTPLIQKGWHYCSFNSEFFGITWAEVKKNFFTHEQITVFNHKDKKSFLIKPENVTFSVNEYMFNHGRFIPKTFSIRINCKNLSIDAKFETIDTHHIKLPFLKYWRYHLRVIGNIIYDDIVEEVNTIQISELMKFF
jgi:hypothetical protein